jgi:mannitol/fructose-specific phosphotransferase system IIA component (Ntr-type)
MKYKVKISETLTNTVTIEANSKEDAIDKVREQYFDCEIILMSDDHEETIFEVEEINDEY